VRAELLKGKGGVFDVRLGEELIYSKRRTGRFPEGGEVEALLEKHLPAS
jgi:predicted Rdx family selenoprotein